jgi:hypothetical protein
MFNKEETALSKYNIGVLTSGNRDGVAIMVLKSTAVNWKRLHVAMPHLQIHAHKPECPGKKFQGFEPNS